MRHDDLFPTPPDSQPKIYAYSLPDVPSHTGYIKIGYTTRDPLTRIREQTQTAGLKPKLLLTVNATRSDGTSFSDQDVHAVLAASHKFRMPDAREWFKCSREDVLKAVQAVRNREFSITQRSRKFAMRPEQQEAVRLTEEYFSRTDHSSPPRFLWNAKMRFGKTFAAYQLCRRMKLSRILVVTFKPAAEDNWRDDIETHLDFEGWQFISNHTAELRNSRIDDEFATADKSKPIVVFGSFQDLLGRNSNGGIKAKNEFIHATHWDMAIFDEYHFGAWRDNAQGLFRFDEEKDSDPEECSELDSVGDDILPISADYRLYLSGTPFRALNSGEFLEEQIYSWTYTDEQKAKVSWPGENNPYASMPRMVMMTYQLPERIRQIAMNVEFDGFDLNEFFAADSSGFKHKDEVCRWLMLIRGAYVPFDEDSLKLGKSNRPPLPFSDSRMRKILRHTVWFLPDVASCRAMYELLREDEFFRNYAIVLCAGESCGCGTDALEPVRAAMTDCPAETKSITLTCGKLLTGVTIRAWTGIFMLRNLKSPETYFQAAFRVQSAWTEYDDDGQEIIRKKECYVFDFAMNRALRQVTEYSCRLDLAEPDPEKKAKEFVNFLPVLAFDGASMTEVDADEILEMAVTGTSGVLLAKKWKSGLLVNLDNVTLSRLLGNDRAMRAVERITAFRGLNAEVETIITQTNEITSRRKGETTAVARELSQEERERKKRLNDIREKLLKFLCRIPLFMYLTDERERTLQDIIREISPTLFLQVTGITIQEFELLNRLGVFNAERINNAIYGFKCYEDSSLAYTGLARNEAKVYGLWDRTIDPDDIHEE